MCKARWAYVICAEASEFIARRSSRAYEVHVRSRRGTTTYRSSLRSNSLLSMLIASSYKSVFSFYDKYGINSSNVYASSLSSFALALLLPYILVKWLAKMDLLVLFSFILRLSIVLSFFYAFALAYVKGADDSVCRYAPLLLIIFLF